MSGGFRSLELAIMATSNNIWNQQAKIFPEVILLEPVMSLGNASVVTSDKLLLTMYTGKPQLYDLNPDTLQAASPQDQLPGRPQILGQEPEQDLTLESPLKLDESKSPTLTLPMLKVPVNSTNQRVGLAIEPKITQAITEGETKKLPIERGPPRDD
ncbi:hypothetical protein DSO57_1022375 [Entomophthora muscae]|uniref:Uncharacterized protein n=1 Tax=Entomophthora muscae TaxID=34485 RepID=A0ACC2UC62_9FUNG|nr:hypothetical protein DSO57_1022375 [Entomophthora muscae]